MKEKEKIIKNCSIVLNVIIFYYLLFIDRNQYTYDMSYAKCIIFMLINVVFIYFYGILKNQNKTYNSNILIYIVLFLYLLITITFIIGRPYIMFYDWWFAGQYKPLGTIIPQYKYGTILSFIKNVLGNGVMMIPLSFLLMMKNKKFNNILRQTLIILPLIVGIELLQAYTHTGAFDIDDIILNYLGVVVFTFIITRFNVVDKIRKLFYTDFKLNEKVKTILFYISLIVLIIFDISLFIK